MSRCPWEREERMSASWREDWEVGHTLQERSQPLQTGARRESGDTALFGLSCTTDPGAFFCLKQPFQTVPCVLPAPTVQQLVPQLRHPA